MHCAKRSDSDAHRMESLFARGLEETQENMEMLSGSNECDVGGVSSGTAKGCGWTPTFVSDWA